MYVSDPDSEPELDGTHRELILLKTVPNDILVLPPPLVRKAGIKSSGPYLGVELSQRLNLLHSCRQNYLQDGCGIQRVGCELC